MEAENGVRIKRQDLKQENGQFTLFKQLDQLRKENNVKSDVVLNDSLFSKYDSLLVTSENELKGEKGEEAETLMTIPGSFSAVQSAFVSG